MRRPAGWATRLRTRWLELVLSGRVCRPGGVARVCRGAGGAFTAADAGTDAPAAPAPSLSPIPATSTSTPAVSAGKFDGPTAFQHVQAQMAIGRVLRARTLGRKTGDYISRNSRSTAGR